MEKNYVSGGYMSAILNPVNLKENTEWAVEFLKNYEKVFQSFDTIAFRGMSGAISAPPIAVQLGKELIMVRKPEVNAHSLASIEGYTACQKYIIVDDFVYTGETVRAIRDAIQESTEFSKPECLGVLQVNARYRDDHKFGTLKDIK